MTKYVEAVVVPYYFGFGKWPESEDRDYSGFISTRETFVVDVRGEPVEVRTRPYTPLHAYAATGMRSLARPVPQIVIDAMVKDLEDLAKDGCTICSWEYVWYCPLEVAVQLRRIFRHSIMISSNDCPETVADVSAPIAGYFDSVIHGNHIWTSDGSRTEDFFRGLGVSDIYYMVQPPSPSFVVTLDRAGFDFDARLRQLREGRYSNDLVFVGGLMGTRRAALNDPDTAAMFLGAGLGTRVHGVGMRDGPLLPRDEVSRFGVPVAALYLDSFSTVNVQFIGLLSMRMFDAWASGTLLIQNDPVGELDDFGIRPGVHYVAYDGRVEDLIAKVRHYQAHMDETEAILRAGLAKGRELQAEYGVRMAWQKILSRHGRKWGW